MIAHDYIVNVTIQLTRMAEDLVLDLERRE